MTAGKTEASGLAASRPPMLDAALIALLRDQLTPSASLTSPPPPQDRGCSASPRTFPRAGSCSSNSSSRGYLSEDDTLTSGAASPRWALGRVYPILKDQLGFISLRDTTTVGAESPGGDRVLVSMQKDVPYFPFCADFGPVSMGTMSRFMDKLAALIEAHAAEERYVVLYTSEDPQERTNAATLVAAYLVLECGMSPEEAWEPFTFQGCQPFVPFRDASFEPAHFELAPIDVLRGLHRAQRHGLLQGVSLACYEHADRHDQLDFHEIVRGRMVAFRGPKAADCDASVHSDTTPAQCIAIFKDIGVTAVVRLNEEEYDASEFEAAGIRHYDLIFGDCTTPTQDIMDAWFDICDREPGCIAVHCKAGIGRTGTLVCAYLQREMRFTAHEAIGYVRVMRPGSVLGLQQQFLEANEKYFAGLRTSSGSSQALVSGDELVPVAVSMAEARRRSEENTAALYSRKASRTASRMAHQQLREARRVRRTSDPGM